MNVTVFLQQSVDLENQYLQFRQRVALKRLQTEFIPAQVWTLLEHPDLSLEDIESMKQFSLHHSASTIGAYLLRIFTELHKE